MDPRHLSFAHVRSADQDRGTPAHHPVVIVGAGPVGLVAALDLASKGHRSVMLDSKSNLSDGSRAICWAKRSLEIMDRLGVGKSLVDKGVTWKNGKVLFGDRPVFTFDLLPEAGHRRPAFINLQQYYFEHACIEAAAKTGLVDLRWREEVVAIERTNDGMLLTIDTPEGAYQILGDWVIAADGARSTVRGLMNLEFEGRVFQDQFLICDIKMKMDRPAERWFWFDPPFNRGRSALLHKQADDVWRLDFQVGDQADRESEMKPENVARRVRAMLGEDVDFDLQWISLYRFQSRRLKQFRHGRIIFAGDSAHQMSPFGARGGNSGVQDADNLGWKLDLVLRGLAPERLIDSYHDERAEAADENLLHTTRSTDFIAPKSEISRVFRDSALALAETAPFARQLINSGRLSTASVYRRSPLNSSDAFEPDEARGVRPGAAALDGPLDDGWFLDALGGTFTAVWFSRDGMIPPNVREGLGELGKGPLTVSGPVVVSRETLCRRYGADREPALYLFRPDQHIAGRWRTFSAEAIGEALAWAIGRA